MLIGSIEAVPIEDIKHNKHIIQIILNSGGHVEFFSGLRLERWVYTLMLDYFSHFVKTIKLRDGKDSSAKTIFVKCLDR